MTQITIDIPDELAQRLAPFQSQFSDLFIRSIAAPLLEQNEIARSAPTNDVIGTSGTYQEILDFLIDRPTSAQIINFKVSEASQSRLQTLLEKNRTAALTTAETTEIDLYEQLDTLIAFLKIRAYAALQATPQN
jgi:arsenate reductase-like glutaredoxin family protein